MVAKGVLRKSINPQGGVLECWKLVSRCKKTRGIQIFGLIGSLGPPPHRPFTSEKSKPYSLLALKKAKFDKALNSKSVKLAYSSSVYFFSRNFFDVLSMQLRPICIHKVAVQVASRIQVDALTSAVAYTHATWDDCEDVLLCRWDYL